jgi:putative restriction endonuclease
MDEDSVLERFDRLNVWSRGDQRAPNKPLLILYALGRWSHGDQADIPFRDVNRDLTILLKEFGPPRQPYHPEYPFWRMQNDGVWTIHSPIDLTSRQSNNDPLKSELISQNVRAGFSHEVKAALHSNPSLVTEIATRLLKQHFPDSLHPDILDAVGLFLETKSPVWKRDPQFRQRVLIAYEYKCAACGLDIRLGTVPIALDAAHIRWHQAGGPDQENNGLALCVLHHKTFDLGAFTLNQERILLVSDRVNGSAGLHEALLRHHGQPARAAQRPEWNPAPAYLDWHGREVFKGAARHIEPIP